MKKNPGCCYIGKPQVGAQGDGIFLFRELKDLQWKGSELLIQRYIDKPLLLDGYKFDLRIYVPLIGTGSDLHAFVADEGLARFCTEQYKKPTTQNLKNQYMHLTNYSLNKMSDKYVHEPSSESEIMEINNATKRTLTALYKQLEAMEIDTSVIKESIRYSCQGIMQMLANMIAHNS